MSKMYPIVHRIAHNLLLHSTPLKEILNLRLVCRSWKEAVDMDQTTWMNLCIQAYEHLEPEHCRTILKDLSFPHYWRRTYWKRYFVQRKKVSASSKKRMECMKEYLSRYEKFPLPRYMKEIHQLSDSELHKPDPSFFQTWLKTMIGSEDEQVKALQEIDSQMVILYYKIHPTNIINGQVMSRLCTVNSKGVLYFADGTYAQITYEYTQTNTQIVPNSRNKFRYACEKTADMNVYLNPGLKREYDKYISGQSKNELSFIYDSDSDGDEDVNKGEDTTVHSNPQVGNDTKELATSTPTIDIRIQIDDSESDSEEEGELSTSGLHTNDEDEADIFEMDGDLSSENERVGILSYNGYGKTTHLGPADEIIENDLDQSALKWLLSKVIGTNEKRKATKFLTADVLTPHLFYHYLLVKIAGQTGFIY